MDQSKHLRVPSGPVSPLPAPSPAGSSPAASPSPGPAASPSLSPSPSADGKYAVPRAALEEVRPGGPAPPADGAGAGGAAEEDDLLTSLEKKSGVPKLYLVVGGVALGWLLVVAIWGTHTFVHFCAFAYPAYMSYKTLEHSPKGPDDDVTPLMHWLTYWVVYALFIVLEFVVDPLLNWMPWYTVFKLAFLFWCFLPQTTGCAHVYRLCIRPFLHANETRIDTGLDRLHFAGNQFGTEIRDVGSEVFYTAISKFGASFFVKAAVVAAAANANANANAKGDGKGDGKGHDDDGPDSRPDTPNAKGAGGAAADDASPLNSPVHAKRE